MTARSTRSCTFCDIIAGNRPAFFVYEGERHCAFLDHRPLLRGHVLLVPREHHATMLDLPSDELGPLFSLAQLLGGVLERALEADGWFMAVNNRISQSVPHLHVHLVPRWKGDGLFSRGMVWQRRPYRDEQEVKRLQRAIMDEVGRSLLRG